MKTERRHELQKNDLADIVGGEIDYVKPYLKTIVGVVIAALAIGFTIAFLSNQQAAKNATAWGDFYKVVAMPSAEDFEQFGKDHTNTQAGAWALLSAADLKLRAGAFRMFDDRKTAEEDLTEAKKLFETAMKEGASQPMIRRRAQLGLGETNETLNDPEAAEKIYAAIVKEDANDPFGKAAAERLANLKRLNDQQWYAWFAEFKPAPPVDPRTGSPLDINNLPGRDNLRTPGSDLNLPNLLEQGIRDLDKQDGDIKLPSDLAPPANSPTEEKKADEEQQPAETPATEEKKTEEAKPEEQPADDSKAEEKPADEQPAEEKKE